MKNDIKLLIIGNARHGKDTLAELMSEYFGLKFISSSQACADIFIYDKLKDKYGYKTPEECFLDRVNHRPEWYQMICDYNKVDKAKLAKEILKYNNTYVGMRDHSEIEECKKQGLFDLIIWVDASKRLPKESSESFNITEDDADIIVENNGTLEEFVEKVKRLGVFLKKEPQYLPVNTKTPNETSIIKILQPLVLEMDTLDGFSMNDEPYLEMGNIGNVMVNWPEEDGEPLNMENWYVFKLTDDEMVMCCGGDWQEGKTFTIVPAGNGLLKCINIVDGRDESYGEEMSHEDIIKVLTK